MALERSMLVVVGCAGALAIERAMGLEWGVQDAVRGRVDERALASGRTVELVADRDGRGR